MPHTDGPAYFPAVATVSLGSYTLLDLYDPKPSGGYEPEPVFSLFQEPRSLLITLGDAYTRYLHGIAERANDAPNDLARIANLEALSPAWRVCCANASAPLSRSRRVSLTFRDIERVHKGLKLPRSLR